MTGNDEINNKSITQQAKEDAGNSPNTVVAPAATPLARPPSPRQEDAGDHQQQEPRLLQHSLGADQDQVGADQGGEGGGGGSEGKGSPIGVAPVVLLGAGTGGVAIGVDEIIFEAPSGPSRPLKRKSEVVAPPGVRPICSVCKRDFYSWKALFGHMRSHPERQWRGCFPPPISEPQPQPQPLPLPQQHVLPPLAATNAEAGEGGERRGLDIDLNQPEGPPIDLGVEDSPPAPSKKEGGPVTDIDINKKPPSEDEDEDAA